MAGYAWVTICAWQCSLAKFYNLWAYWRDTLQYVILWMCYIQVTDSTTEQVLQHKVTVHIVQKC